ncbi:CopG family ribbon-helix-helix protein [Jeotgalibacillus proteolyticus]|uniref:Uncharacterized protein n=1 Tax=Jeotgalibacillus proteolyticus TaxID=2082395 RepID=A0A2S5G6S0_9BACL|nr:ribbon-helix-helix domain-containing protein [Jeotgalibacillus proteolyticus]PPA68677.1 hypothetical protein C4B60_19080 [Jeotgalibacillus proteolyticus]PPA68754.1 hypothetical protein C4B60_19510 [Jeotgalibacillus proteolyticus]
MSNKNNLKDKIKKPNAPQAFFNSYDTKENVNDSNNNNNNETIDEINVKDNNTNNNKNIEINNNKTYVNDNDVVDDNDYLRELAAGKKAIKKKPKKVFTSFYMDPDLAAEVDKIAARGEKGDKSRLINQGIRSLLEEYGVINKS